MTYYKLGCNWGTGKPDFYNVLIKHSIVICAEHNMNTNDIVAITKGYDVIALARIKKHRVPVSQRFDLEEDFKKHQIDYADWNSIAEADIWELNESEKFQYKLQQGICQIQNAEIKKQIDLIISSRINDMDIKENIKNLLYRNKNIILTGAPGTGKTYLAKQIAAQIILVKDFDEENASTEEKEQMKEQYSFVQFHPSYDYTDFVEGLRPKQNDDGSIGFERRNGIFKDLCEKAVRNPQKKYVIVIDEINRGEISKIFGELFFSIDPGYRGEKGRMKTQYQNLVEEDDEFYDGFYVPKNVYVIGTMNDIDRSVESMDFAFRRRFAFKEIKAKDTQTMLEDLTWKDEAIKRMDILNGEISKIEGLSSAYHIGANYFLKLTNYEGDFDKLWDYHIEGLLREYLRGMQDAEGKILKLKEAYDNGADSNNGQQQ